MSYGPDLSGMFRRAADFVDKLPHGEKPGDMPVQNWKLFETGFMVFGFALQGPDSRLSHRHILILAEQGDIRVPSGAAPSWPSSAFLDCSLPE
jgi:hypothetical protein